MKIEIRPRGAELAETVPPGPPPGTRLSGHTDRSGTTIHGWGAVAFGSIFAAAGTLIVVLSTMGKIQPSGDAPLWVVIVCGLVFAAPGFWLVQHGLAGVAQRARTARWREANPREPWRWDHSWNRYGSRDDSGRTIGRLAMFAIITTILLLPFNWVSFFSAESQTGFKVITGIFDVVVLGVAAWAVYLIVRRVKYGVGMLRFKRFPLLTGGEVEVMLERTGPLAALPEIQATLRCVQERYEVTRRRGKRQSRVVSYEVWSETRASEAGDGRQSSGRNFVWRFTVPAGVAGTSLSERPPRYWEVEIRAEMPGVDYRGVFLVPVYEDVRAGRERQDEEVTERLAS